MDEPNFNLEETFFADIRDVELRPMAEQSEYKDLPPRLVQVWYKGVLLDAVKRVFLDIDCVDRTRRVGYRITRLAASERAKFKRPS